MTEYLFRTKNRLISYVLKPCSEELQDAISRIIDCIDECVELIMKEDKFK